MSGSFIMKDLLTQLANFHIGRSRIKCQDRREFLVGIWMASADARLLRHQDLGSRRNLDTGQIRDHLRALAYDHRIHGTIRSEDEFPQLGDLLRTQEICSLTLHLFLNGFLHVIVAYHGLLGSADRTIIKGLGIYNPLYRQRNIRRLFNISGSVSGTYADSRSPG